MSDVRTDSDGVPLFTYREAAARVRRSVVSMKRWRRRRGMPMGWAVRDGQRVRVVREDVLLAYLRSALTADPAHQYRIRKNREGIQG